MLQVVNSSPGETELFRSDTTPIISCVVFYVQLELEDKVEATLQKKVCFSELP